MSSKGYSLIDLVMSLMVSTIVLSIVYSIIFFQYDQFLEVKALHSQNMILLRLKSAITAKNILASKLDPANYSLQNCLTGIDDVNCSSDVVYPIKITDGEAVTGTPDSPVEYNLDGNLCNPTVGEDCVFQVSSSFRVQCAESIANPFSIPPACPLVRPGLIEIFYEFKLKPTHAKVVGLGIKQIMGSIVVRL